MQDDPEFKWGLAGHGDLAERRLIEALHHPPHRIVAVWGRNPSRASAFAERFDISRAVESLEELTEDVDAVYVATPPVSHLPVAMTAVQAGRHVLIEKPLSPTFCGYENLLTIVAKTGVQAVVSYYRRCAPVVQCLRQILNTGQLGRIQSIHLSYVSLFNPKPNDPQAWRVDPAISGGGVTADAGSHRLDLLCWLFGKSAVVDAKVLQSTGGVDSETEMTLVFASGVSAYCRFAWGAKKVDRLDICGEKGTVRLDPLDSGHLALETDSGRQLIHDPPPPNLHRALAERFRRKIVLGSEESLCTLPEAHAVDVLLETVYDFGKTS